MCNSFLSASFSTFPFVSLTDVNYSVFHLTLFACRCDGTSASERSRKPFVTVIRYINFKETVSFCGDRPHIRCFSQKNSCNKPESMQVVGLPMKLVQILKHHLMNFVFESHSHPLVREKDSIKIKTGDIHLPTW